MYLSIAMIEKRHHGEYGGEMIVPELVTFDQMGDSTHVAVSSWPSLQFVASDKW